MTTNTALYATQGGGYATYVGGQYVWHSEIPEFVDAQVGDPIPEEWSVVAINDEARHETDDHFERAIQDFHDSFGTR